MPNLVSSQRGNRSGRSTRGIHLEEAGLGIYGEDDSVIRGPKASLERARDDW